MPNKKLRTKQRNKIIAQGTLGLSKKKSAIVKDTLKKLIEKSQEGLKPDDDNESNDEIQNKPIETAPKIASNNKQQDVINKKSKKNKYFFLAHPDKKEKVKNIDELSGKFVLEKEKVEKIPQKKITETYKTNEAKKSNDTNEKTKSLWVIEPCTSSSEDEQDKKLKPKKRKSKPDIDLNNIKFERVKETLEDGTVVETFKAIDEDEPEEVKKPKKEEEISESEQNEDEKEDDDEDKESQIEQKEPKNPLMEKLNASRFRYLNEMLYKNTSNENFIYFKEDSDAFKVYHQGFEAQAHKWPINPLDEIIKSINNKSPKLIIADFGCGTARLAQSVKNKVHSFDLVASNELVTACDMKNVPLNDKSCDIAVFCLSLMGKNIIDFISEAHRILKLK